jgi:TetR/AcrR family transcriptional regulator, transcriptional repressor for nem operon
MDTHDRLVASTGELLWERGYVGTSPRAIQQRAGAGQGSMYHHFTGKPDLALAAVRSLAEGLRGEVDAVLSGPGSPLDRITAYLRRQRDVLRGCRVGRLAQDPEIVANDELRAPVEETFAWLTARLAGLVAQAREQGEVAAGLDPEETATALLAVLQGGYVLARAAGTPEPFDRAVGGALALLTATR